MSGFTQTSNELLYAYYGAGTVSVPTASPGSSMTLGYPPITVPGGYMSSVGEHSSSLRLCFGGIAICTATLPIWQFTLWATTAQPATYANSGSAFQLALSTAIAPVTVTTGCPFECSVNLGLRTTGVISGAGSNTSTIVAYGDFQIIPSDATGIDLAIPIAGATYSPTCTTWPQDQQVYLWPTLCITGATAGNTTTMEYCKLYGEN
jgi:hypothetical protein